MIHPKQCLNDALQTVLTHRHAAEASAEAFREQIFKEHPDVAECEAGLIHLANDKLAATLTGNAKKLAEIEAERQAIIKHQKDLLLQYTGMENPFAASYACRVCCDTGYVDGHYCDCVKKLANRKMVAELNKDLPTDGFTFEEFSLDYYDSDAREKMEKNLSFCKSYAERFSESNESLLITGHTGLGKTHLTFAIGRTVTAGGSFVIYTTAGKLIEQMEREHFGKADAPLSETFESCDLLILDDLGTEFLSQLALASLYQIINQRLNLGLPTIINTNLTPNELEERYGERLASRLLGCYKTLHFVGRDIRIQKRLASKKF